MRYVVAAAAVIMGCGLLATSPVRAEPMHYLGAEVQAGGMCWASTSPNDQGYWKACPKPMHVAKHMKKAKS